MAEKNISKFPYTVLPNLSSEENHGTTVPNAKVPRPRNGPLPKSVIASNLPPITVKQPEPLSPRSVTSSKALTRHIAMSKQFAAAAHANSLKEVQAAQRRILLAHYEMRKSPRSLYPSDSEGCDSEPNKASQPSEKSKKLSLEALAQLFPHRIQGLNSSVVKKECNPVESQEPRKVADTIYEKTVVKVKETLKLPKPPVQTVFEDHGHKTLEVTQEQLKTRIDGLAVHVTSRDNDTSQLKRDLVDLQLLVLKEKKESEKSRTLVVRLNKEIAAFENKICSLEKTLETQEQNILDKLLLLDGMDDFENSDSEPDFSRTECKPSAWISSTSLSPSQKPTQPKPEPKSSQTDMGALKECVNWVPVAPDFDKLLQIICLLNFRMDRNQSMKLHRTGNATSFKHADTINLTLFKNGLILGKSGFRSYATLSVIKMINEMFSGYFPSELHAQFPDGVVFVVTDKRSVLHELNPSFFGPGMKLSDSKSSPILIPGLEKLSIFSKPRKTIKSAETTPSCISVSSKVSSASSSTSFCNLPELPPLNDTPYSIGDEHKMIVLKLKNTVTGQSHRMRASTSSTVDEVLGHVEKFTYEDIDSSTENSDRKKISGKVDLVLPVPHGILTYGNATLKEYGFFQNTLLYLKPIE